MKPIAYYGCGEERNTVDLSSADLSVGLLIQIPLYVV
jgi:hypothetical protein